MFSTYLICSGSIFTILVGNEHTENLISCHLRLTIVFLRPMYIVSNILLSVVYAILYIVFLERKC